MTRETTHKDTPSQAGATPDGQHETFEDENMLHISKQTANDGFDYEALEKEPADLLKEAATKIKSQVNHAVLTIGKILFDVKSSVGHGTFQAWISAELGLSPRTAERYMSAAELVAKSDKMSVLKPSCLYLLAAPSTPQSVVDKIKEQIQKQEKKITVKDIRAMIREKRPLIRRERSGQRPKETQSNAGLVPNIKNAPRKSLFRITADVRKAVENGDSPADADVFWARVRRKEDGRLVIGRLAKASPK